MSITLDENFEEQSSSWIVKGQADDPFMVKVKRWSRDGKYIWNVYVYIYPGYPSFLDMTDYQKLPCNLHGGCNYQVDTVGREGELKFRKFGCDYCYANDTEFERTENPYGAWAIFKDAKEAYDSLRHIYDIHKVKEER